jgi:hypothetical protein
MRRRACCTPAKPCGFRFCDAHWLNCGRRAEQVSLLSGVRQPAFGATPTRVARRAFWDTVLCAQIAESGAPAWNVGRRLDGCEASSTSAAKS